MDIKEDIENEYEKKDEKLSPREKIRYLIIFCLFSAAIYDFFIRIGMIVMDILHINKNYEQYDENFLFIVPLIISTYRLGIIIYSHIFEKEAEREEEFEKFENGLDEAVDEEPVFEQQSVKSDPIAKITTCLMIVFGIIGACLFVTHNLLDIQNIPKIVVFIWVIVYDGITFYKMKNSMKRKRKVINLQ